MTTKPFLCERQFSRHPTRRWWISAYGVVGCEDCVPSKGDPPGLILRRGGPPDDPPLVLAGHKTTPAVWPLTPIPPRTISA